MIHKNVLITGGAGFIGSHLTEKLYNLGYKVTVLDNLLPQIHGFNQNLSPLYLNIINKCNFIKGDVCKRSDWNKAINNNEIIIHLAAETGTGQSMYEIGKYVRTNSLGTANLLDILVKKKHYVKKVIIASSRAIYGEGKYFCAEHGIIYPKVRNIINMKNGDFDCKCPTCNKSLILLATDEESKIHPTSVYGITKYNQEELVMKVCKSVEIPAVAFRFQNVYGPGQSLSNPYTGILSIFSKLILGGNEVNIFEDGNESRDFIYIDDIVELIRIGIEKDAANFECFNGGTGMNVSVKKVAELLIENYSKETPIRISGAFRFGDIRHNFSDNTKIKNYLNFIPKTPFEIGIYKFSQWVMLQNHSAKSNDYIKSINEMKSKGLFYER